MLGAGRTSRGQGIGVRAGNEFGDRRSWSLANTRKGSMKSTACQVICWISFEWSRKTLKCLQVTSLKVEVQECGCGGKVKILNKRGYAEKTGLAKDRRR